MDVGRHAHSFELFNRPLFCLLFAEIQDIPGPGHAVVQHRHVVEEVEGLKHHPHLGSVIRQRLRMFLHRIAMKPDLPACGSFQMVDAAKERGLSGTRRSQDTDDFPLCHIQIDFLQHFVIAKTLGQIPDTENRCFVHMKLLSILRRTCIPLPGHNPPCPSSFSPAEETAG